MRNYSELKKTGLLVGTIKAAQEKSFSRKASRNFSDPIAIPLTARFKAAKSIIPLGTNTESEVDIQVRSQHTRKKNWRDATAVLSDESPYMREWNCGRYSSRCTYTHYEYQPMVGSWAIIVPSCLYYHYAGQPAVKCPAPFGYKWAKDKNGIHIVDASGKKDYHPNSDDLRNYSKSAIRQKAIDNYNTRKALVAETRKKEKETAEQKKHNLQLIRKAEKEGAMVCLKDSLRAGNCHAGTTNFANRHGLDVSKHYRPTSLLKIANGQADRVALAVAVGLRRHYSEMRQGFCELENHVA